MAGYRAVDPDGVVHYVANLAKYCLDNNLSYSAMGRVANGHAKSHKGWTIKHCREDLANQSLEHTENLKIDTVKREKDERTLMYNTITGEEVIMDKLTDFCEERELNKGAISLVCKGIRKSHKGWTVKQHQIK